MYLPYNPVHSVEWLEKYLKTNYYKKKYDRFMWWRSYTLRNNPLSNRHSLRDRILNGDFELGSFTYEIELVEHRLNEKHKQFLNDDIQLREAVQLDKARRKRLQEDRDKDETSKLEELKKSFLIEFKMTGKQYDREIIKYTGPDLINFYYRMEDKFGKKAVRSRSVPKFR
tara:strand:+ start:1591 stop:2100 length:510 start_codon:yes stop_codon:yes gene_type:complete